MRVLVVEDSRTLADALAEGLRDEGFAVDVAYDGVQAATKLDLAGYHVIVLDRDLPGLHGDTVCRMITERDAPAMVLMLTASGDPGQRVSGLRLGADDYLSKPFHFPELVLRVRALARRRPAAQPRVFRAAGIELNPLHHTATRHGRPLGLSSKEFAVLEALSAPGARCSAPSSCSLRCGTSKPIHSPTQCTSRSAGCAASLAIRRRSRRSPMSATGSSTSPERRIAPTLML